MSGPWATFDCYGTLIDWNGGIGRTLETLWPDAEPAHLLRRHHAIEPLVQDRRLPGPGVGRALPYHEVLARSLRAIAAIEGLPLEPSDEYALADSLPSWPAFPEVPAALAELRRRGWQLAILSNTDPELLAASLLQIGVPIDVTITAAEAGSYKPSPGHWERFYERTGADLSRHIHIAASLFHDIAPAQQLGIPAVWINRLGEQSEVPRVGELVDLSRLPETLAQIIEGWGCGVQAE